MGKVLALLEGCIGPQSNELLQAVYAELEQLQRHPEFACYLAAVYASEEAALEARQQGGLLLKNYIRAQHGSMNADAHSIVKTYVLQMLGSSSAVIQKTTASIITTLVSQNGLDQWKELHARLVHLLRSPELAGVIAGLTTLDMICEDSPDQFQRSISKHNAKLLSTLFPLLIAQFDSQDPICRALALHCVNQFWMYVPRALINNLDRLIQGLYRLTGDPNQQVRIYVCQALTILTEMRPDAVQPAMRQIIEFMLHCMQDEEEVVLNAAEFWTVYCNKEESDLQLLAPYLQHLLPLLMDHMRYSEFSDACWSEEDDDTIPDRPEDLRPIFHQKRQESKEEEDEETDWGPRKVCARTLAALAVAFGEGLLQLLNPLLKEKLHEADWKSRESAILAIGAVAEGCFEIMEQYLPELVEMLFQFTQDTKAAVRSIAFWTLSQYSYWLLVTNPPQRYGERLLSATLQGMQSRTKLVQESACSTLVYMLDLLADSDFMSPFLPQLLTTIRYTLSIYQRKSLVILFDIIGRIGETMGSTLVELDAVNALLEPLFYALTLYPKNDPVLVAIMESITFASQGLGMAFAPFAEAGLQFGFAVIKSYYVGLHKSAQGEPLEDHVDDLESVVCALDMLSAMLECLSDAAEQLITKHRGNLFSILIMCLQDHAYDVRQSATAVLGDVVCGGGLACLKESAVLDQIMPVVIQSIRPEYESLCSNSCWVFGEVAIRDPQSVLPLCGKVLGSLSDILHQRHLKESLLTNAAITLSRIGLVHPVQVVPMLAHVIKPWTVYLAKYPDDKEKRTAFEGLYHVLTNADIATVAENRSHVEHALQSWTQPFPEDLYPRFSALLHQLDAVR